MLPSWLENQHLSTRGLDIERIRRQHNWNNRYQRMTDKDSIIEGVLFDWELTLARTIGDVSNDERLTALFHSQGLSYTPAELQTAIEQSKQDFRQQFSHEMPKPQSKQEIIEYYQRILTCLNYSSISPALLNSLYDGYASLPTYLYDATLPTLKALKQKGLTLGIISNHTSKIRALIQQYVGNYIPSDHIVISQEVGAHKPAQIIFQQAVDKLSIAPERSLFVGDSLNADAIGAVSQGGFKMGLWLDRYEQGDDQILPPNVVRITSLHEVLNFV